uniref:OTU domain-containing protein n=1 Tax=Oryza punctata TaxID=4537 RepID=A0A0E0LEI0_ORYPU
MAFLSPLLSSTRAPTATTELETLLSRGAARRGAARVAFDPTKLPLISLRPCQCPFGDRMSEQQDSTSKSSSSSISSSTQESEEEVSITIGSLLAQAKNNSGHSLGRRLSQLGSIPHTPRVNGKIPNLDNATLDHERLSERLGNYGLAEFQIEGDGNCQIKWPVLFDLYSQWRSQPPATMGNGPGSAWHMQLCTQGRIYHSATPGSHPGSSADNPLKFHFRALADQIFRNPDYHKHVRKLVMKQEFRKQYESYVPMEYKVYLKKMKRSGEWGDHLTLQAAADRVIDTCLIEIVPRDVTPTRELWLSFWCEVHYNSLYATDDLLTRKTKKKHWLF